MIIVNFVNKSRVFFWFVGGFNYQIEYYFFFYICYVYYCNLFLIVKVIVKEYNILYYEYDMFISVLVSYFKMLYDLGIG